MLHSLVLIASHLVTAQSWRQINSGLPVTVEGVRALTFDTGTSSVAYAVTATGSLFKTSDGGGTWKTISAATSVNSIILDPKNPANVYAATWRGILEVRTTVKAGRRETSAFSPTTLFN